MSFFPFELALALSFVRFPFIQVEREIKNQRNKEKVYRNIERKKERKKERIIEFLAESVVTYECNIHSKTTRWLGGQNR